MDLSRNMKMKFLASILEWTLQASVLSLKIKNLKSENLAEKIAEIYLNELDNSKFILPVSNDSSEHALHLFCVRHKKRNKILDYLKSKKY